VFESKFAGDEMAQKLGLFQGKARNSKRTIGPESDLGAGACQEGRPYFVMEYVAGIPITAYCYRHKLTVRQRMEAFILVCDSVHHAHQKAIIYRDVKPSNILVCEVDGKPMSRINHPQIGSVRQFGYERIGHSVNEILFLHVSG
jgi:serine/threonine protein kinase